MFEPINSPMTNLRIVLKLDELSRCFVSNFFTALSHWIDMVSHPNTGENKLEAVLLISMFLIKKLYSLSFNIKIFYL